MRIWIYELTGLDDLTQSNRHRDRIFIGMKPQSLSMLTVRFLENVTLVRTNNVLFVEGTSINPVPLMALYAYIEAAGIQSRLGVWILSLLLHHKIRAYF